MLRGPFYILSNMQRHVQKYKIKSNTQNIARKTLNIS